MEVDDVNSATGYASHFRKDGNNLFIRQMVKEQ